MQQFLSTETLIIELLLVASIVAILVRRLQVPYTVALVVVGLLLTSQSPLQIELTPELILALFVPPLVFEAAFHLNFNELQKSLGLILILAIPGVVLTTLIVGGVLALSGQVSLMIALVFGSLVAATDPVAVVSIFRPLSVPKRLAVLVEGESLFNDGTAIVLFNLVSLVALTGEFNLLKSVGEFVRVSAGGIVIGLGLGWAVSRLIARIDDYLIEMTLTTVLAFGSYLIAEQLHFSGVLAVVAAGLVNGNLGPQGMSPTTRIVLYNFWKYVAFLSNSLVFLLIGLEIDIPSLVNNWQPIVWAVCAVILARMAVVYGLGWAAGKIFDPISLRWKHILTWGGLRGALSLALALSLPLTFGENRFMLRAMAFGVVLFTLLVQATTMRPLIRRLGIVVRSEPQVDYEIRHARLTALRAAETYMERRHREGLISAHAWEILRPKLQEQSAMLADSLRETLRAEPTLEAEELDTARREILRAQRSSFMGMRRDGVISDDVFEKLSAEIDGVLEEGGGPFWFVSQESLPQRLKEGITGDALVEEILVEDHSKCAGHHVRDIPWPDHFVVASLRRGTQVMIPRGDTMIKTGDVLVVVADDEGCRITRNLCQSNAQEDVE